MKKLFLAGFISFLSCCTWGQGQLIFANNTATRITNLVTGLPAAAPATQVGLYIGNVGDPTWSLTLVAQTNCFIPGTFSGGVRTLSGWGAGTVQLQVRAWLASTVYPSYEAAYAAAIGGDGSVLITVSAPFNFVLTTGTDTPQSIATGGLTPMVFAPIPEPSSVALGLLGFSAFLLFRRKR